MLEDPGKRQIRTHAAVNGFLQTWTGLGGLGTHFWRADARFAKSERETLCSGCAR